MTVQGLTPYVAKESATAEIIEKSDRLLRNPKRDGHNDNSILAALMTQEASTQSYYTIRYLVDQPLMAEAYRAYAYFRWVDDIVDQAQIAQVERLTFLTRQQEIIALCYQGERPQDLSLEEQMIANLIGSDPAKGSGLHTYINQMMAVMRFDAERQGQLISQKELATYTHRLSTAVTEALHYFIGHNDTSPYNKTRYLAVTGAHITHMLRDAVEDTNVGYYNVPQELLQAHRITPADINHAAYRIWVQNRVYQARRYFTVGKTYLAQVENWRCRLAGYAYIARFEVVLDAIEKDGYWLRATYPERKHTKNALKIGLGALLQTMKTSLPKRQTLAPPMKLISR